MMELLLPLRNNDVLELLLEMILIDQCPDSFADRAAAADRRTRLFQDYC